MSDTAKPPPTPEKYSDAVGAINEALVRLNAVMAAGRDEGLDVRVGNPPNAPTQDTTVTLHIRWVNEDRAFVEQMWLGSRPRTVLTIEIEGDDPDEVASAAESLSTHADNVANNYPVTVWVSGGDEKQGDAA
jgi:hypothetical protein